MILQPFEHFKTTELLELVFAGRGAGVVRYWSTI